MAVYRRQGPGIRTGEVKETDDSKQAKGHGNSKAGMLKFKPKPLQVDSTNNVTVETNIKHPRISLGADVTL